MGVENVRLSADAAGEVHVLVVVATKRATFSTDRTTDARFCSAGTSSTTEPG
jgi:hypothetical protein